MTHAITVAAVAPLLAAPSVRAEQVSQLVLGATAQVLEAALPWLRLRVTHDGYEGWAHMGYLRAVPAEEAERWAAEATGWSEGAVADVDDRRQPLPLGARVAPIDRRRVRLPDGRVAVIFEGEVHAHSVVVREARRVPAERWALARFAGAPYLWGGVTPWGVDCSGLVQATYAARGVWLPRDARDQVACGAPVAGALAPGDLLFFRGEQSDGITHVAFRAEGGLIHSALGRGGVVEEPWAPDDDSDLARRLVAARRLDDPA